MEQLTTIAYLAGVTTSIKLLSSVMVLPHRSPVLTAKMLATIDVLSQGRLIVGCGVGWMEEEFEAIGAPPYAERGAVGNEYLRVFKELWTSDDPSFDGDYANFSNIAFAPKPVQQPHPPLWIGGESPPALRRAGQLGDAWYPICSNPSFPWDRWSSSQITRCVYCATPNARAVTPPTSTSPIASTGMTTHKSRSSMANAGSSPGQPRRSPPTSMRLKTSASTT